MKCVFNLQTGSNSANINLPLIISCRTFRFLRTTSILTSYLWSTTIQESIHYFTWCICSICLRRTPFLMNSFPHNVQWSTCSLSPCTLNKWALRLSMHLTPWLHLGHIYLYCPRCCISCSVRPPADLNVLSQKEHLYQDEAAWLDGFWCCRDIGSGWTRTGLMAP